jgi:NitT/TauT family transport system substrate-binding protein
MTTVGKIVFGFLILLLIGTGVFVFTHHKTQQQTTAAPQPQEPPPDNIPPPPDVSALQKELAAALPYPARLPAAQEYQIRNNTLEVELSEWVGYAGLIAYNGGLDPNPNSEFTRQTGFLLKLTVSEDESWDRLVGGKLAGSSTTTDVLAVYGKQLNVVVPGQIDFSRGADAIVVRNEISKINDLVGKIISCCQFTESDFLIRDLAREAGLEVNVLPDLHTAPDPTKINIVVTDEGLKAGDVFIHDVKGGFNKLAGCVTWSPKTEEVVANTDGKTRILTTNRNLLLVSDILMLNRPFAEKNPKAAQALTTCLIAGNALVEANPAAQAAIVEKAFKWDHGKFADEFKKVHLSNLPENLAYFAGTIDSAGSFPGIYQMAVLSYGPQIIKEDAPSDFFADTQYLTVLQNSGTYASQKIAIAPIKIGSSGQSLEQNPLLSKNIRFDFEPNSATLATSAKNDQNITDIKALLRLSPGSTIMLRGHVDDAQIQTFRTTGGQQLVDQMSLKAMQLSQDRANSVKKALVAQGIDPTVISVVGKGWEEPIAKSLPDDSEDTRRQKSEKNRRVEAVWMTIE